MESIDFFKDEISDVPKHIQEVFFLDMMNNVAVLSFNESYELVCGWFLTAFDLVVLMNHPYIYSMKNVEKEIEKTQKRFLHWMKKYGSNPCVIIGPEADDNLANKFQASFISTEQGPISLKIDINEKIGYIIKEGVEINNCKLFL